MNSHYNSYLQNSSAGLVVTVATPVIATVASEH